MTEKSTHVALMAALEKMNAKHVAIGEEMMARIEERMNAADDKLEVRGRAVVSRDAKLNEMGAEQVEIQRQMNDLRAALEGLELAKRDGGGGGEIDARNLSLAKAFIACSAYRAFSDDPEMAQKVGRQDMGSIWAREGRSRRAALATRADNNFDSTNNADLVKPDFRDEIVIPPKNTPLLRSLSTVLTTDSDTVEVDRELVEYAWVSCAADTAIATDTELELDDVGGLGITAPYNALSIESAGGDPEEVVISAIDTDTNIVTFAPALARAVAIGDRVSADCYLCTPDGERKPQSLDTTEAVQYPVCTLASYEKASEQILTDSARSEQLINQTMLSRQARNEDKAGYYGPGGAKQITGIFPDADVPRFDWNVGLPTGTTKLDHLIDVFYEGQLQNYNFNAAILYPTDHKEVSKSKDDEGAYIFPLVPSDGAPPRVFSMALLMSNQLIKVAANDGGDFVMGDFMMGITFYDRENDTIAIGTVNDDFTRNLRTIRIERRFAMAILHPLALAKGTFIATPAG